MATDWVERWFSVANEFASWSKDRSTKVGCVIVSTNNQVLSGGYNGFPRGVDDDLNSRHARPAKYLWTEHAERNAIYNAARHGISLDSATIYVPLFPCADCARGIIQTGIKRVVTTHTDLAEKAFGDRWTSAWGVAYTMFVESGIDLIQIGMDE